MTYQLETTTVDTYETDSTESLEVAGSFSTDKRHTDAGTWTIPATSLEKVISEATPGSRFSSWAREGHNASYQSGDSPVPSDSGFHVARVIVNPTDNEKARMNAHSEDNRSLIKAEGYGGAELKPGVVNQVYVYFERDWQDLSFETNDQRGSDGVTSSTKAKIVIAGK